MREEVADQWARFDSWQWVLPPSRPSVENLDVVDSVLKELGPEARVAVLGSTPEFRALLHARQSTNVFVFERNAAFYEQVSRDVAPQGPEQVIRGDWFESLPHNKDAFDLILSDLTIGNIPYDRRAEFYGHIAAALRLGGLFVDKVLTHPGPHEPISRLLEKYERLPFNLSTLNSFNCEVFFCSDLLDLKNVVDTSLFFDLLSERIASPRLRLFLERLPMVTPPGCRWFYGERWKTVEADYCRRLTRVSSFAEPEVSPYARRAFQIVHRKDTR